MTGNSVPESSIKKNDFKDYHIWNNNIYVIPEYCFAVEIAGNDILLLKEHSEYKWVSIKEAQTILYWDSNKTALWELEERIESKEADGWKRKYWKKVRK